MASMSRIPVPGTQAYRDYRAARHAAATAPIRPRQEPKLPDHPLSRIIAEVSVSRGVSVSDIVGRSLQRKVVRARHEAMWRARHETAMSLPDIAQRIGSRDHTIVLHGVRQHQRRLDEAQGIPTVSPRVHRAKQIEVLTAELLATRRERDEAVAALKHQQETTP